MCVIRVHNQRRRLAGARPTWLLPHIYAPYSFTIFGLYIPLVAHLQSQAHPKSMILSQPNDPIHNPDRPIRFQIGEYLSVQDKWYICVPYLSQIKSDSKPSSHITRAQNPGMFYYYSSYFCSNLIYIISLFCRFHWSSILFTAPRFLFICLLSVWLKSRQNVFRSNWII